MYYKLKVNGYTVHYEMNGKTTIHYSMNNCRVVDLPKGLTKEQIEDKLKSGGYV